MRLTLVLTLCALNSYAADLGEDLLAAVRKGDIARVRSLLDQGANVNAKSAYGATPLFFAADRGHAEIAKMLIERGADVNSKDTFYGATALTWAAMKERTEIIKLLLAKNAAGVEDVLETGVEKGNVEMVKVALDKGGLKPEALTAALAVSTKNQQSDIAELLRKAGAVPPPKADYQVDPETLQSYAGTYGADRFEIKFRVVDGKLTADVVPKLTLDAIDKTTFRPAEMPAASITFNVDGGKVTSLTFRRGAGEPMVLKKSGAQ